MQLILITDTGQPSRHLSHGTIRLLLGAAAAPKPPQHTETAFALRRGSDTKWRDAERWPTCSHSFWFWKTFSKLDLKSVDRLNEEGRRSVSGGS